MIKSIQFIDGFATELPNVGTREFIFNEGINVLFSGNGTGKSTILKTLKAYCAIKNGGWTLPTDPAETGVGRADGEDYPHCYSTFAPSKCKAVVKWDGTSTFFNDGDIKTSDTFFYMNVGQSEDGITTEAEQFDMLIEKPSSGQHRLKKLNKVLNILKDPPPNYSKNDLNPKVQAKDKAFAEREIQYWKFINDLYKKNLGNERHTILLDEPERSLSLPKQKELFLKILPEQLKDFQVIIATHSIFSLYTPNVNLVELQDGYVKDCIDSLKNIDKLS